MLGYKFVIDTGKSKPVSIKPPDYGLRESVLMMDQIGVLKHNDWIREFPHGGWGAGLVLAPRPHQENVTACQKYGQICPYWQNMDRSVYIFRGL